MDTSHRISWFNRILLTVVVVGGIWCLLSEAWLLGVLLLVAAAVLGAVILLAARGRFSDTTRLDAVQPFDERERAASTWSFAVVGRAAIIGMLGVFITQAATREGRVDLWVAFAVVLLCVVWGVAIRVAVRRG